MFFKNLCVLRVNTKKTFTVDSLIEALMPASMPPAMSLESQLSGWVPPRDNGRLVESVGKQYLIALGYEKKLLPASVINQFAKIKAQEMEEQQGFKPGRKQMREIKEQVTDELLPRAFMIASKTLVWIDMLNGWLVVNTSSSSKLDDVVKLVLKSIPDLEIENFHVKQSPLSAMTQWLSLDEAPSGFTVDQDSELRSSAEGKATVRYVHHTLETADMQRHIASGKQCTSLALTWKDRISFVLTETMVIKKIAPLDILKESEQALNDDERFAADFTLMTGELNSLLNELGDSLGGRVETEIAKAA